MPAVKWERNLKIGQGENRIAFADSLQVGSFRAHEASPAAAIFHDSGGTSALGNFDGTFCFGKRRRQRWKAIRFPCCTITQPSWQRVQTEFTRFSFGDSGGFGYAASVGGIRPNLPF